MFKKILLLIYYFTVNHLPSTYYGITFFSKRLRPLLLKFFFCSIGKGTTIENNIYFGQGNEIEVGDFSGIGINARIQGPLSVGNYVMMGPNVTIYTENHKFDDLDTPISTQGFYPPQKVVIQDNVWIGANVIILPGVTIGSGAIVGAGAIVTKDVPCNSVVGGNPAKVIKFRKNKS